MTLVSFAAILLLLVGTFLEVPVAVILSIVVLVVEIVAQVWTRFGLSGVTYRRRLERDRIAWGDEIPVTLDVWNRKRLPLAWLRADDAATPGITVRERSLAIGKSGSSVLRNAWTLAPFERVSRRFHVSAERRGVYELGPVELSVGDLFAREAATEERPDVDRFLVRPRTVPTTAIQRRDMIGGTERARFGLAEDPSRFAGIRDYAPGDSLRRIHPRASARLQRPVVKRFEPSRDREVVIALDVQTATGPAWQSAFDAEEVEALFVVVASLARSLALERAAFGLAAAGYHGAESRLAWLPVSEAAGQAERVFDLLARLSSHPSAPFEHLLGAIRRDVRPGATILVVSARDPSPYLRHLRGLAQAGWPVVFIGAGRDAAADVGRARLAGLAARTARLDGPWRTATGLAVSG